MAKMGFSMGLESGCYKRLNRWMFRVDSVIGDFSANALPPEKSARPSLSFKENMVKHLIEDVYYPAKPDWKPITVVVWDLKKANNPLMKWLNGLYDPKQGKFFEPNKNKGPSNGFIRECYLDLYNGCGDIVESWIYEDAWPQGVNGRELDMNQTGIVMTEVTIRYARAYISN